MILREILKDNPIGVGCRLTEKVPAEPRFWFWGGSEAEGCPGIGRSVRPLNRGIEEGEIRAARQGGPVWLEDPGRS